MKIYCATHITCLKPLSISAFKIIFRHVFLNAHVPILVSLIYVMHKYFCSSENSPWAYVIHDIHIGRYIKLLVSCIFKTGLFARDIYECLFDFFLHNIWNLWIVWLIYFLNDVWNIFARIIWLRRYRAEIIIGSIRLCILKHEWTIKILTEQMKMARKQCFFNTFYSTFIRNKLCSFELSISLNINKW